MSLINSFWEFFHGNKEASYEGLAECVLFVVWASAFAAPYVTNVVAKQRYPWNGLVDVSYEIVGSMNGIGRAYGHLEAIDQKTQKSYPASTFTKPIDLTEGTHTAIWNMAADHAVVLEAMTFRLSIQTPPLYRVIDVSAGSAATSYPVLELDDVPDGGWSDDYKTNKIVLRRIEGTDGIYYAGVFLITDAQWDKVMGGTSTSTKPIVDITYNSIRGDAGTYDWPTSTMVDATRFIGKLRQKTGLTTLDLPSEAEWEFAARAGATTKWLCGDSETGLSDYAWYGSNSGNSTHPVGELLPNAWGLYDVHGNVLEWCLDRYWSDADLRVLRGGSYCDSASCCSFSYRDRLKPYIYYNAGFRLFCRPESN